jgi:hypothetical protein
LSAASMELVKTFSSISRPALRAAACGGRPRAGNNTTGTEERPHPQQLDGYVYCDLATGPDMACKGQ